MSANLAEFLKVLTIVITWSTCILLGRHYMLTFDFDGDESEDKDSLKEENELS